MVRFKRIHKQSKRHKRKYPKTPVVRKRKRKTYKKRSKQRNKTRKHRGGAIIEQPKLLNTNGKTPQQYAYEQSRDSNQYVLKVNKAGGALTVPSPPFTSEQSGRTIYNLANLTSRQSGLSATNALTKQQLSHNKQQLKHEIEQSK